ncbi:MAG: hypothetical protein JWR08_1735 [Enterovirga sp.]|nr:hypothetical protein [Enterovirga sp.]
MNDDERERLWAAEQKILGLTQVLGSVLARLVEEQVAERAVILGALERCERELERDVHFPIQHEAVRLLSYEVRRRIPVAPDPDDPA